VTANSPELPAQIRLRRRYPLWRIALGGTGALLGIALIVYTLVPVDWREQFNTAVGTLGATIQSLGLPAIAIGGGLILLGGGIVLMLLPRSVRSRPADSPTLTQVSVYWDLENQGMSGPALSQFLAHLKREINGRKADLFFYIDATKKAENPTHIMLWRYGFRPVVVLHRHGDNKDVKNIADFELALHAYERALGAVTPQQIIIISRDQGFIPLLYRLRALGHEVSVWCRFVPISFKQLEAYIDITTFDLAALFHPSPDYDDGVAFQAISLQTLADLMKKTLNLITIIRTTTAIPSNQMQDLQQQAQTELRTLDQLGFQIPNGLQDWLNLLEALSVLKSGPYNGLPLPGSAAPHEASGRLQRFLMRIAHAAYARTSEMQQQSMSLDNLHKEMLIKPPMGQEKFITLVAYLRKDRQRLLRLCQCAKALGVFDFSLSEDKKSLAVVPPVVALDKASEAQ
jgi:hypothetical protein